VPLQDGGVQVGGCSLILAALGIVLAKYDVVSKFFSKKK